MEPTETVTTEAPVGWEAAAVQAMAGGVLVVDAAGTVRAANPAAVPLVVGPGRSPVGAPLVGLFDEVDRPALSAAIHAAARTGAPATVRLPAPATGRDLVVRVAGAPGLAPQGAAVVTLEDAAVTLATDGTFAAMRTLLDGWAGFVGITDDRADVVYLNRRACELLGRPHLQRVEGLRTTDLFDASTFARYYEEIRPVLLDGGTWSGVVRLAGRAAPGVELRMLITAGVGPGRTIEWLTAVGAAESEAGPLSDLAFRATHDALTGLANRELFLDRLRLALLRRDRARHPVSVVFIDVDGFKAVNDEAGHLVGDRALRVIGDRVAGAVRPADTAARWGGDEFVVLCEDLADGGVVARRVADAVAATPVDVGDRAVPLTVSVGYATAPPGPSGAEELVAAADTEMYRAKGRRRRNG